MKFLKIAVFLLLLFTCPAANCQERISKESVNVVFPESLRTQADAALELYMQAAARVRQVTGLPDPVRVTIELAESELAFKLIYKRLGGGEPAEYALAVAFTPQNVILVHSSHLHALGSGSLPETLVHETFHIYLGSMLHRSGRRVPLWFNEGIAQWVAGQKSSPQLVNMLRADARSARIPALASLSENFPKEKRAVSLAYAQSLSFVGWLEARKPGCVREILSLIAGGEGFEPALRKTTGEPLANLEEAWRRALAGQHSFLRTFFSQLTLFSVLSLIAIAAFVRYLVKRKKLHRKLEEEDLFDGY